MAKIERTDRTGVFLFYCPGCHEGHWFSSSGITPSQPKEDLIPRGPKWGFNDDLNNPTVTGSVLVKHGNKGRNGVCHSLIKDGKITYCGDTTHELSGKTVDLPDFDSL